MLRFHAARRARGPRLLAALGTTPAVLQPPWLHYTPGDCRPILPVQLVQRCMPAAAQLTRSCCAETAEQLDALASLLHHTWRNGAAFGAQVRTSMLSLGSALQLVSMLPCITCL